MKGREQYVRYKQDRKILAAIGACLDRQVTRISVRLPRPIAESAVAAWNRDELDKITDETREEYDLRTNAADLALIGLAITSRGVWTDHDVIVDLHVGEIAAALRATSSDPPEDSPLRPLN